MSDEAGVVRVVTPEDAAPAARVARVAGFAPPPAIGLKAARTVRTVARAAQTGRCENKREMTDAQVTHRLAVVGELNNAYNDGTWGRFTYGRGGSAETSIGVAASYGPGVWTISGTKTISDEGEAMFPLVRRRFARRLLSQFEFHKQSARNNTCAHWDTYISAAAWDGGNADRRQRGTLDKCDPDVVARWTDRRRVPPPQERSHALERRCGGVGDQSHHAIRVLGDGDHRVRLQGAAPQGALHLRLGRPRVALHRRAHLLRRAQVDP